MAPAVESSGTSSWDSVQAVMWGETADLLKPRVNSVLVWEPAENQIIAVSPSDSHIASTEINQAMINVNVKFKKSN